MTNNTTLSHIGDEENLKLTMATSYSGKLDEFDHASGEDWTQYIERMEYYLANGINSADKQRAVLISAMGAKAYKTLRNLSLLTTSVTSH